MLQGEEATLLGHVGRAPQARRREKGGGASSSLSVAAATHIGVWICLYGRGQEGEREERREKGGGAHRGKIIFSQHS